MTKRELRDRVEKAVANAREYELAHKFSGELFLLGCLRVVLGEYLIGPAESFDLSVRPKVTQAQLDTLRRPEKTV